MKFYVDLISVIFFPLCSSLFFLFQFSIIFVFIFFIKLVKSSDVFVENFAHGKIDALGFGYEELKKINPSLVYASICGFGFQGPERNKPGYDLIAQAVGGLMSITGPEGGNSCIVGISITDIMTGMYANGAILSALYERMITGKGKKIDTSLLQTQVAFLCHVASNYLNTGRIATRHGTAHGTIVPYQVFLIAFKVMKVSF